MTTADITKFIKDKALELGFEACGIAKVSPIPESEKEHYQSWLTGNRHAGMHYMERNQDKRYDPRLLVEGCRSIIAVALNYEPVERQKPESPTIARFAYGKDYHHLIRTKLKSLLQAINDSGVVVRGRAFADSAPIAERYWAQKAGLGWIGKNRQLILPGKGSAFLLGELLVDINLDYDHAVPNRCGSCRRCLEACPTEALHEVSGLDANRCLSYLTIEKHDPFSPMEASWVGESNCLFGCDKCQDACPWNRFASGNSIPELQAKEPLLAMKRQDFEKMKIETFRLLFDGTCLERTGYDGLIRNLKAKK